MKTKVTRSKKSLKWTANEYKKAKKLSRYVFNAAKYHRELLEALKKMLAFSDSRMKDMSRTAEEASFADRVSDLIAKVEEE